MLRSLVISSVRMGVSSNNKESFIRGALAPARKQILALGFCECSDWPILSNNRVMTLQTFGSLLQPYIFAAYVVGVGSEDKRGKLR
jgi:hypothetical protein